MQLRPVRSYRGLFLVLLTAMLALLVTATAPMRSAHGAEPNAARIRVIHASPDAPAVDVYINGRAAVKNLAYKKATDYLNIAPGSYRLQVTPTGAAVDKAVIDANVTLEPGKQYSVVAAGKLAQIKALVLVDAPTAAAPGKAKVRVIHAAPDAPAVDVAVKGGPVLVSGLGFGQGSPYVQVDQGVYNLEVRPAGTTQVALAIPGFAAESGRVYTVVALGELGNQTLQALPLVDR